jgi:hypothetical protein
MSVAVGAWSALLLAFPCAGSDRILASVDDEPVQNLLSIDLMTESHGVIREQRLVDGRVPAPDSPINDFVAALFLSPEGSITFDLREVTRIAAVQLVAFRDSVVVEWSIDGADYHALHAEESGYAGEMTVWTARPPDLRARYLRLTVRPGFEMAAAAEFLGYPPTFESSVDMLLRRTRAIRLVKFLLALISIPLLIAAIRWTALCRRVIAIGLVAVGALGWIGFGAFHGDGGILHPWEILHYYLGPKYFQQLGHTELYRCLAAHEREHGRGSMIDRGQVRDLDDNRVYPGAWTATESGACRAEFDAEQRASFGADADRIRRLFKRRHFHKALEDHGYNATPLQTTCLEALCSKTSPTHAQLSVLVSLDFLLLAAGVAAMWWAFGPLAGAACALLVGLAHPWNFSWTGGSILRYLWFAALCGGVALLKRKHVFWGGFLTALAGVLRLFPLVLLTGLALQLLRPCFRLCAERRGLLAATGVVVALALGLLLPLIRFGPEIYPEFVQNIRLHGTLPPGNHIGLGVLWSAGLGGSALGFDAEQGSAGTIAIPLRQSLWIAGVLAAIVLVVLVVRRDRPLWQLVPLAAPLVFATIPLSNYDYMWIVILAPIAVSSAYRTILLFGFVALTCITPEFFKSVESEHMALSVLFLLMIVPFSIDSIPECGDQESSPCRPRASLERL